LKNGLGFKGNNLLEKLYISNLSAYEDGLNLSECPSLLELNAVKSTFTDIKIADGAPVRTISLENPSAITLSNLNNLSDVNITNYNRLKFIDINNIDNMNKNLSKNITTSALNQINPD
jgi:hypothetical protein